MQEERKKVLEMLSQGKIKVDEAERLLSALVDAGEPAPPRTPAPPASPGGKPRYLRVLVTEENGNRTNVRVPLQLIRAGVKLSALIPDQGPGAEVQKKLAEKGIDFDARKMSAEQVEELIQALTELEVEVDGTETVRVFCE